MRKLVIVSAAALAVFSLGSDFAVAQPSAQAGQTRGGGPSASQGGNAQMAWSPLGRVAVSQDHKSKQGQTGNQRSNPQGNRNGKNSS